MPTLKCQLWIPQGLTVHDAQCGHTLKYQLWFPPPHTHTHTTEGEHKSGLFSFDHPLGTVPNLKFFKRMIWKRTPLCFQNPKYWTKFILNVFKWAFQCILDFTASLRFRGKHLLFCNFIRGVKMVNNTSFSIKSKFWKWNVPLFCTQWI